MASRLVEWVLRVKDETGPALDSAASSAHEAAEGIDEVSDSAIDAEQAAGRSKEVMEGFASALDKVSPAAGAAVRGVGLMAGALKSAAAATGASLAVLGPLTVAIGAAAGAYLLLSSRLEDANAKLEVQRDRLSEVEQRTSRVAKAELELARVTGVITDAEAARIAAQTDINAEYSAAEAGIRANIKGLELLNDALGVLQKTGENASGSGMFGLKGAYEKTVDELKNSSDITDDFRERLESLGFLEGSTAEQIDSVAGSMAVYQAQLAALTAEKEKLIKATVGVVTATKEEGEKAQPPRSGSTTTTTTTTTTDEVEAIDDGTAALERREAAIAALSAVEGALSAETISDQDAITSKYREQFRILSDLHKQLKGDEDARARIALARIELERQYNQELLNSIDIEGEIVTAAQQRDFSQAQRGIGIAQGVSSGSATGIASSFGPIGAIVAAVLGILEGLGKTGAEGVGDRVSEMSENINQGIRELPALIGEELPDAINASIGTFTEAILESLPELIAGIVEGSITAVQYLMGELPTILWEALKRLWEEIKGLFGGDGSSVNNWATVLTGGVSDLIGGIFGGGRDRGAMSIDRTGMYVVHQGEQIVQRNGRQTQSAHGGGSMPGGSGISVTVNASGVMSPQFGDVLADFIREQQARGLVFG